MDYTNIIAGHSLRQLMGPCTCTVIFAALIVSPGACGWGAGGEGGEEGQAEVRNSTKIMSPHSWRVPLSLLRKVCRWNRHFIHKHVGVEG